MDGNESDGSGQAREARRDESDNDDSSDSGGASGEGGGGSITTSDDEEEEQPYDITIAASHSYLGPGLVQVRSSAVLEAGWQGRVAVLSHHGVVFPGETVPMLLPHSASSAMLVQAIKKDKLFGLLFPDETGVLLSGYGVLCEVLMAGIDESRQEPTSVTFKARATHRFRLIRRPKRSDTVDMYSRTTVSEVVVLAEMSCRDSLRAARLASLDPLRRAADNTHTIQPQLKPVQQLLRTMDAAVTSWPLFVYDIFDLQRMRHTIREYFKTMDLDDKLPCEPVSLSFWVASNLALTARERLALFVVDNALLRLHMEVHYICRNSVLCCTSCLTVIARREHIFAMSSEGVHSNYTNLGGYMHDILTVSEACNVETPGAPSAEYSWFPGYTWTIAHCATCLAHVGWRFEALKRNCRPQQFYGLCRNYVHPATTDSASTDDEDDTP